MADQGMAAHDVAEPLDQAYLVPSVLVVDDDEACAAHCCRMLDELGYHHHRASTAREALDLVSRPLGIQIVLADMELPSLDGFVLIEEARARIGTDKPLAVIMMTHAVTADLATRGLHIGAVDLLCKPVRLDAYALALRRARQYVAARTASTVEARMLDFGQQLARLVSVVEGSVLEGSGSRGSDKEVAATLRAIIGSRGLRSRFFPSSLFADPAWDILLDLTRAKLEGQEVSVSSVCIAASVPMSTALRWVRQMTEVGLLRRWTDPKDRRRDLITLTEPTTARMKEYLTAVRSVLKKV